MTRDTRHLGHPPFWRGRYCAVIAVLIASIPVWLSPSSLFASVVTLSAARHHAKPARRGVGTPDSFQLPTRQVPFFGRHTAYSAEKSVESAVRSLAPIIDTLPRLRSRGDSAVSHTGAMSVQAQLSVLQSRALPLLC